ncbi:hypothetical protein COL91_05630 [Bacillus pseudomycoides]|nr:hypothetical protein CON79_19580 [Bacillus pseudomycoides]PEE39627.1 hypothetical protein COO02_18340 [Bacillus pseudomycoides]PEI95899.1 hypothetical protein CN679_02315 [Bacillus pseudomycoides]PGA92968.1 hypothetical protein COL91_05630 [Bacillus pseudomycoides]PHB48382.1 hypothetical protein COE83_09110 [Bacillus pseudomycoides]
MRDKLISVFSIQIMAMKPKGDSYSFPPSVFTWHGAKKGSVPPMDGWMLSSHQKRKVFPRFFYGYLAFAIH